MSGVDAYIARRAGDAWTRRAPASVLCEDGYVRVFIPALENPAEPKTAVVVVTRARLHSAPPGSDFPMVRRASGEVAQMGLEELAAYLAGVRPAPRPPQGGRCSVTCELPELCNSLSEALSTISRARVETPEQRWARQDLANAVEEECVQTSKKWFPQRDQIPDVSVLTPESREYRRWFCQMSGVVDGFIDVLPDGRLVASEKYRLLQQDD